MEFHRHAKETPYLSLPQLERYWVKLQGMRRDLLADVGLHDERQRQVQAAHEVGDVEDAASESFIRELDAKLSDRDRRVLSEIDDALERIKNGKYGICESSGESIAEARLEAMPTARYTVAAQAAIES